MPSPDDLRELARSGFERLCEEFPDQKPLAGTLFLGKQYARSDSGVLMLGVNPGASDYPGLDLKLHQHNYLLEGPAKIKIRYWTNARRLFRTTDALRTTMEAATYSFCCPYRTIKWNGLGRDRIDALIRNSKPIMARMLADCNPKVIIVAGAVGLRILGRTAAPQLHLREQLAAGGDASGRYRWQALQATHDGRQVVVIQVPHLSRASSKVRLAECGTWLSSVVSETLTV